MGDIIKSITKKLRPLYVKLEQLEDRIISLEANISVLDGRVQHLTKKIIGVVRLKW
jgi:hypothetical protein